MWVRASMVTCAAAASSPAWRAVECAVSAARSASSSAKVASCTSRSASQATSRVMSEGAVSPVKTAEVGPRGQPELAGAQRVELARARILHECEPEPLRGVLRRERGDPVPVALEHVVRRELDQDQLERES